MARPVSPRANAMRLQLAQTAARIMAEEGVRDFLLAKRKAAERIGFIGHSRQYPTNLEIEDALGEYLRLFHGNSHRENLRSLRETARAAMRLLAAFDPRVVGPVLNGMTGEDRRVNLHVFADTPEQVVLHLLDNDIPFETAERRLRTTSGDSRTYPVFRFLAGEVTIDITVFGVDGIRQAPASPVDGRPMRRGTLSELESLLAEA